MDSGAHLSILPKQLYLRGPPCGSALRETELQAAPSCGASFCPWCIFLVAVIINILKLWLDIARKSTVEKGTAARKAVRSVAIRLVVEGFVYDPSRRFVSVLP